LGGLIILTSVFFRLEEAGRAALQKRACFWPVVGKAGLGSAVQRRREDDAYLALLDDGAQNTFCGRRERDGSRSSKAAVSFLITD